MIDELSNILIRTGSLYRKYGIKSVTMDDVSHELGISKKTLYQYVQDKDDLVGKVVELEIAEQNKMLSSSCAENLNAVEELVQIARCISFMLKDYSAVTEYDLKKYFPDLYTRVREVRRERIMRFVKNNLIKGKEEGIYREEIDIEILSKLSLSHIDNMFENEIIPTNEFLDQRFFFEYFIYHLRGIVNDKGLKILEDQEIQKLVIRK